MISTNREMANLMTDILERNCQRDDETMKSNYQIEYEKRGQILSHVFCKLILRLEKHI